MNTRAKCFFGLSVLILSSLLLTIPDRVSGLEHEIVGGPGIFEWFQKPAAIRFQEKHDRTYVTWISQQGQAMMRVYDQTERAWREPVTVANLSSRYGLAAADDHNAPSMLMLPDGTALVFSAVHDRKDALGVQRMTRPEDETSFSGWKKIYTKTNHEYNYPQPKRLPSGRILLFFRIGRWHNAAEAYAYSDDNGRTWSKPKVLVNFGRNIGIYAFVTQRGNTIHMTWNQRVNSRPSNLYYAVSHDGGQTWQTSSGRRLILPITRDNAERIINKSEPLFGWDIITTGQGQPVIAFVRGLGPTMRYSIARRTSRGWRVEDITKTSLLYGAHNYYAGGIVIDPRNSNRVLLSTKRTRRELEVWYRTARGWRRQFSVTSNSSGDHFRPQFVANDPSRRVVWSAGIYGGFNPKVQEWNRFSRVNIRTAVLGETIIGRQL